MKKRLIRVIILIVCLFGGVLPVYATNIEPQAAVYYYHKYIETSFSSIYGDAVAVTPEIEGPGTISYGQSKTITSTFSASVTSGDINTIIGKLGASFSKSASSNENFGMTFMVEKDEIKRVYFQPKLRSTVGKIERWKQSESELYPTLVSTKNVNGKVVTKVGKFADGKYYAK